MIRLTLYGRVDCHLCHEMRAVIDGVVAGRRDVVVEEVDVDSDPALARAYGLEVPVLAVNGQRAFAGAVTPAALRARLAPQAG
jgi:glutaredoxin